MRKNTGSSVCVVSSTGKRLMPTNPKRARQLLKNGRAQIAGHDPFTIRLLDRADGQVQDTELKIDAGYGTIGVSVCTAKKELFSEERKLLPDEKKKHQAKARYRRARRNRKRYRKPRYHNRKSKISEGEFAPSIRNKRDQHVAVIEKFSRVLPITRVVVEVGSFDTQVLSAIADGRPAPVGEDYQHGPRYGFDTLRDAVFARDLHKCQVCGSGLKDGAILRVHHIGYRKGDRSNRIGNLLTVCSKCHTAKNHQKGGALWSLKPKSSKLPEAAFMNSVRWSMIEKIRQIVPGAEVEAAYGSAAKEARRKLQQKKSHANDAYSMGRFHPKKRAATTYWQKRRRNNRVLEKFFDAHYIDLRDGEEKSGKELSSDRTNRSQLRNGSNSQRKYRAGYAVCRRKDGSILPRKNERGHILLDRTGRPLPKLKKGYRQIRHQRYPFRPGDTVFVGSRKYRVKGTHNKGKSLVLGDGKAISVSKIEKAIHAGGWERTH